MIEAGRKKARLGLNPYNDWVAREGLIVREGVSCDLLTAETKLWPRYGVNGAAVHSRGRGDFCNMFVLDIPAGASTEPQQHLYEEVIYVVEGRGSTQLEFADGSKRSFEWQPRSMFAIPLNAKYRLLQRRRHRTRAAVIGSTTTLPLMMKIFHNDSFIFENEHFVRRPRSARTSYYTGEGDLTMIRAGQNIWETNFVPDLGAIELTDWNERGAGSTNMMFVLADSNMHAHMSEIPPGTYKKAHRHGAGAHIFTVTGNGYSLLWYEGETEFQRVDWKPGVRVPADRPAVPPALRHQPRAVALSGRDRRQQRRYPLTDQQARYSTIGKDDGQGAVVDQRQAGRRPDRVRRSGSAHPRDVARGDAQERRHAAVRQVPRISSDAGLAVKPGRSP